MSEKIFYVMLGLVLSAMAGAAQSAEGEIIIDPNLIGWWPFEEGQGSLALDASGHGNHATLVGDPQWAPGYDGLALDFDGHGDYLDTGKVPSQLGVAGDAPRTVALWVYTRSFNGGGLYEMGGHVSAGDGFCLKTDTSNNQWRLVYGTHELVFTADSLDQWVHITHVNNSYHATVYVNGKQVMSTWRIIHTPDEVAFRIGVCKGAVFDGLIDDVRLYDRVIEPEQIVRAMGGDPARAWGPHPAYALCATIDLVRSLRWSPGTGAVEHDVYLGTDRAMVNDATRTTADIYWGRQPRGQTTYLLPQEALDWGTTYYWRIDEIDAEGITHKGGVWMFTVADALMGWWKFDDGEGTVAKDSSGHGNHATLVGDPQWVPGYDGLALDFDGRGDYIETGKVPSQLGVDGNTPRTVALWAYTRSFNGGGLYEMGGAGARQGFSLRTTVYDNRWRLEYGSLGTDFVLESLGEWVHLTHVNEEYDYDPLLFANGEHLVDSWHLLDTTDDATFKIGVSGGACFAGLIDDVRLYSRAVTQDEIVQIMQGDFHRVWNPRPVHGSVVTLDEMHTLRWAPGAGAIAHDVYLGTDAGAVESATAETDDIYQGRRPVEETAYVLPEALLAWDTTYYWRVDEVDDDGTLAKGPLWRFATLDYLIVDDFESYTDDIEAGGVIWETWIDGWENGTGSFVGYYEASFAHVPSPVHGGKQSMPVTYDNTVSPWYSEVVRTWEPAQDWTRYGVDTLTLHFIGRPPEFLERADGSIVMSGVGSISGTKDYLRFEWRPLHGDGSIVARIDSVAQTDPNAMAGVMIRWDLEQKSQNVALLVTAGNGISFQYRREEGGPTERTVRAGPVPPYWVKLVREGSTIAAQCSPDGVSWSPVTDDPDDSSVEISSAKAFIGLTVVTPGYRATSAEFLHISVGGSDANGWEMAEIGTYYSGNDPEPMYVGLADAAGNLKVVTHPDPLAVGAATWQRWDIPLSEFASAGVDVTAVGQMIVGFGDRDNPTPAGGGMVHFDDFWLTRSTAP